MEGSRRGMWVTFNQTRMELKLSRADQAGQDEMSFNQTRMELKHDKGRN